MLLFLVKTAELIYREKERWIASVAVDISRRICSATASDFQKKDGKKKRRGRDGHSPIPLMRSHQLACDHLHLARPKVPRMVTTVKIRSLRKQSNMKIAPKIRTSGRRPREGRLAITLLAFTCVGDWTSGSTPHPRKCSLTCLEGPNEMEPSIPEGIG